MGSDSFHSNFGHWERCRKVFDGAEGCGGGIQMATAWSALAFDTPVDAEGDEVSRMSSSTHLGHPPADLNSKFSIDAEFWFPIGRQVVFLYDKPDKPKKCWIGGFLPSKGSLDGEIGRGTSLQNIVSSIKNNWNN